MRRWQARPVPVTVEIDAGNEIDFWGLRAIVRSDATVQLPKLGVQPDVLVYAVTSVTETDVCRLEEMAAHRRLPVVLAADDVEQMMLSRMADVGVVGIMKRATMNRGDLGMKIHAAAWSVDTTSLDRGLVRSTMIEKLRSESARSSDAVTPRLSAREAAILRLLADGADTAEIAKNLSYSEATVKNVYWALSKRFDFRSRAHAVAFAVKAGVA